MSSVNNYCCSVFVGPNLFLLLVAKIHLSVSSFLSSGAGEDQLSSREAGAVDEVFCFDSAVELGTVVVGAGPGMA